MKLPLYQVDAFASRRFTGNPAAVCPLGAWLPEPTMQAIAAENNLSETAFLVPEAGEFAIRWFTPEHEIDLCGHATLGAGYVVLRYLEPARRAVSLRSPSGVLRVEGDPAGELTMALPRRDGAACPPPPGLAEAIGAPFLEVLAARDYVVVLADEAAVRNIRPDFAALGRLDRLGVAITAPGREVDFVSRFFAPKSGVPEDPVTGSAHSTLVPYWAGRLGRDRLRARQLSRRGGELRCALAPTEVILSGRVVSYLVGEIEID
jgi:PhzF family phenazine biosynthesis protein